MFEATKDMLTYQLALRHKNEHEAVDFCGEVGTFAVNTEIPDPQFAKFRASPEGSRIPGGGKILKSIKGMGTIYDWRDSPWSPPNGGVIKPIIFAQHIPVVPNMAGIADFVRLRDVLVAQGLMIHNATDRDGNIALYTHMNRLCYQARGANQFSCGTEHMHASVSEPWTKKNLRASAWLVNQANLKFGIPIQRAKLGNGNGVVRVARRGQTSHQEISQYSGYNDRIDPGKGYDWNYVTHCVFYFRKHGHFEGA